MDMTTSEIVASYREAKDPSKQIKILADLNGCTPAKIRKTLEGAGCTLPKKNPRMGRTFPKPSAPEQSLRAVLKREAERLETRAAELPGLIEQYRRELDEIAAKKTALAEMQRILDEAYPEEES